MINAYKNEKSNITKMLTIIKEDFSMKFILPNDNILE